MYSDLQLTEDRPVYIQVKDYMKRLMLKGGLQAKQKLPSTRELSTLMKVSRSTVLLAYAELEDEGLIYAVKGKGNYVSASIETPEAAANWELDWTTEVSEYAIQAEQYDLMKHGSGAERG